MSPKLGSVHVASAPATGQLILLDPGAVGVTTADCAALWRYDRPQGQIQSAADGAGDAARGALEMTTPNPAFNLIPSAIGAVVAPVAAAVGGINGPRRRLPQDKLAGYEAGLAQAMAAMSQQTHLRDRILDAAQAAGRRRFVPLPAPATAAPQGDPADPTANPLVGTLLETTVEELRLERTGKDDTSFALRIKARVRTVRRSTGQVLSEEAFEYQSGTELFLDWALNQGEPFQKCTDYGYQRLAEQIVARLVEATGEAPIQVGAGAPPVRTPRPQVIPAAQPGGPALPPRAQFVSQVSAPAGTLYVYPAPPAEAISVQRPLTKDAAVSEALSDFTWSMDGLDMHPNAVVSLTAIAVAIPVSLYQQTAAAIRGVSARKYHAADTRVTTATRSRQPAAEVAQAVAASLGQRSSEAVVLLDSPRDAREQLALAERAGSNRNWVSWPGERLARSPAGSKVLKIEVLSAALNGKGDVNPSLAVHLEARATLLRGDDGREIYSCPVHYHGQTRKFTSWAANDAKLLREELQRCYRELSNTVTDQLVARRLIAPSGKMDSLLAGTQ